MHFLDQTAAIFPLQCVQSTVIVHLHRRSKWCHPIILTVNPSHLSHHATETPKFQIAVAVGGVVSVVLCCVVPTKRGLAIPSVLVAQAEQNDVPRREDSTKKK